MDNILFKYSFIGLPLSESILPNHLKSLGYKNHIIGKWHLGHFKRVYTPLLRGFDSHYGYWTGHQDYFDHTAVESVSPIIPIILKCFIVIFFIPLIRIHGDMICAEILKLIGRHLGTTLLVCFQTKQSP